MRLVQILTILMSLISMACAKTANSGSDQVASQSVEDDAATTAIEMFGKVDDEQESDLALGADQNEVEDLAMQEPEASSSQGLAACEDPAVKRSCRVDDPDSVKYAEYSNCLLAGTRIVASGFVKLTFNNLTCSIDQDGKSVQRTYDLTLRRINRRGTYQISSAEHRNFWGDVISGGQRFVNTERGYSYEVLGSHHVLKLPNARLFRDISVNTSAPIQVTTEADPRARTVNGGPLLIHHNLAKFTASYEAENVTYVPDCKCPVEGTIQISYRGSINAGGSIKFLGCGQAELKRANGRPNLLILRDCRR
ncbi:MAG: hypothetical protein AB7F86_19550 [Bdellovibrionales bacterium]